MIEKFNAMVNRIADSEESSVEKYSRKELISWCTGCMMEGLPDDFHRAWVEYSKKENDSVVIRYKCILIEGGEIEKFEPADHLYPVQCIDLLDDHLAEQKKQWKKCTLSFTPESAQLKYE